MRIKKTLKPSEKFAILDNSVGSVGHLKNCVGRIEKCFKVGSQPFYVGGYLRDRWPNKVGISQQGLQVMQQRVSLARRACDRRVQYIARADQIRKSAVRIN